MSTSAQRTRSRGAQTKSALGIGENCYLRDNRLKCKRGGDPMPRSALLAVTLALVASVAAAQGTIKIAILGLNVVQNYERYKYWFRVTPVKDVDLARTLFAVMNSIGQQIRTDLKTDAPKVAILAEKAVWTEALVAAAQKNLPAMKMEVVGTWQPSATATDVTAELSAIDRSGAHIVFTMLSGPVGISVGRQMGERNMKAVAWGINVEGQKEEFWQAAAGKAQFVSTLDTYSEVEMTPKTIPFVRAFKERFKKAPTYTAVTYDAIMILKAAIEQAGSTDADKLVPVIEKMEHVGTAGTDTWDKRHDLVWAVGKTAGIAVQWQDGKKVPFWAPNVQGIQPFQMPKT